MEAVALKNSKRSNLEKVGKLAYARTREKIFSLKTMQNGTGIIIRPNNKYWRWSLSKISKEALLGGPGD